MTPEDEKIAEWDAGELAAALVTAILRRQPAAARPRVLRQIMGHAAAGLTLLKGERYASETAYRIADAMLNQRRP